MQSVWSVGHWRRLVFEVGSVCPFPIGAGEVWHIGCEEACWPSTATLMHVRQRKKREESWRASASSASWSRALKINSFWVVEKVCPRDNNRTGSISSLTGWKRRFHFLVFKKSENSYFYSCWIWVHHGNKCQERLWFPVGMYLLCCSQSPIINPACVFNSLPGENPEEGRFAWNVHLAVLESQIGALSQSFLFY